MIGDDQRDMLKIQSSCI